jgi:hypothetical protein
MIERRNWKMGTKKISAHGGTLENRHKTISNAIASDRKRGGLRWGGLKIIEIIEGKHITTAILGEDNGTAQ